MVWDGDSSLHEFSNVSDRTGDGDVHLHARLNCIAGPPDFSIPDLHGVKGFLLTLVSAYTRFTTHV